jgi:hypothetical protein
MRGRIVIAVILVIAVVIVAAFFLRGDTDVLSSWRTGPDGWADISLTLYDDNTFEMKWRILEEAKAYDFSGSWKKTGSDSMELTFGADPPEMEFDGVNARRLGPKAFLIKVVDDGGKNARMELGGMPLFRQE